MGIWTRMDSKRWGRKKEKAGGGGNRKLGRGAVRHLFSLY
jgi:hypothetical protein